MRFERNSQFHHDTIYLIRQFSALTFKKTDKNIKIFLIFIFFKEKELIKMINIKFSKNN